MLGKLIKYDLKYGVRIFIIIHAILLIACAIGRFLFLNKIDFDADLNAVMSSVIIFTSVYIVLFSAVSFGLMALLVVRFYKNLFTDEGYLTWTLPATPTQHLWAKVFSGFIWYVLDVILNALSILILVTGKNVTEAYARIAPDVTEMLGMPISKFGGYMFLFMLISSLGCIIILYLCIAVGQLFPGHRILCAIVTYFIITTIIQVITLALMFVFNVAPGYNAYIIGISGKAAQYMFTTFKLSTGISAFITIAGYFGVHYIMNKKINLN